MVDAQAGCPTFTPIDTSARRFRGNVCANLAYFGLSAGIQLFFIRYLIDRLGVATYGLVPLAANITSYMALVTFVVSGAVGRFITFDLAKSDIAAANLTFNTALFASIGLVVVLLPVAGAVAWYASRCLDVPRGQEAGVRSLLACTCLGFLLNVIGSSFGCSTFVKNRFDVQRAIDAIGLLTQVGVVLVLFAHSGPRLIYVGLGIMGATLVRQAAYQVSWRRLTPELRVRPSAFDRRRLRELLSMGGWLTISQAGYSVLRQTDLLLANLLVGSQAAGGYAAAAQWTVVLTSVSSTILSPMTPPLIAHCARGHYERMSELASSAIRVVGIALALPIGIVCGLAVPISRAWLHEPPSQVPALMAVLTGPLCLQLAVTPLFAVNQAMNRLIGPAIANLVAGAAAVGLSVALSRNLQWGIYGVAAAVGVTWTVRNAIYIPMYTARTLGLPPRAFWPALLPGSLSATLIAGTAYAVARFSSLATWVQLVGVPVMLAVVYLPIAFHLLSEEERAMCRARR